MIAPPAASHALTLLFIPPALQYLHFPNIDINQIQKLVPPTCPHHILLDNSQLNYPLTYVLFNKTRLAEQILPL
jgi:hypothetical protein